MGEGSKFWWVNQGRTYHEAKQLGYIWASVANPEGRSIWHWENVAHVLKGDILFHYVSGTGILCVSVATTNGHRASEQEQKMIRPTHTSWVAQTSYRELSSPIDMERISNRIRMLALDKGPIKRDGNAMMGYLFNLTREAAEILTKEMKPSDVPAELSAALKA
jgi:hypothetical protein